MGYDTSRAAEWEAIGFAKGKRPMRLMDATLSPKIGQTGNASGRNHWASAHRDIWVRCSCDASLPCLQIPLLNDRSRPRHL